MHPLDAVTPAVGAAPVEKREDDGKGVPVGQGSEDTRRQVRRVQPWLERSCEKLLDVAVVILATWTAVYHVCLLLRLGVAWAVAFQLVSLTCWVLLSRRSHSETPTTLDAPEPNPVVPSERPSISGSTVEVALLALTIGSAAVAAVVVAVGATWPLAAALWLTAGVAGTVLAVARNRAPAAPRPGRGHDDRSDPPIGTGVVVALGWAVPLAVLSMFTRWPNPDDLYYVNLSQGVVDNGTFPVRDTIFSDLVFPMSSWPPVASYDALAGTLAWLGGVQAASVVYLVMPPVATFLSVLALWRLLRQWRVEAVGVAVSLALVFLLFNGGPGYAAPGNLFLTRIWQGKVILLCLMVPLLLVYALRYVERPTRAHAGWLFAGGAAAVGLSTTAMFLVPLLALAGVAPLCARRPRKALMGFVAMAAYPLAAGTVTLAANGRSADFFGQRSLFRFDPAWFGPEILRDGPLAAIAVGAVLLGALLVPHRAARVTTGLLVVITGVTFVPGVTQRTFDLVGLGPTLWRVSWVASIAALVGVLGAHLASRSGRRSFRFALPVALAVVLIAFGLPIWSEANGVSLDSTPQWKRGRGSVVSAQQAIDAAAPGDVILAPQELSISITVMTTRVNTVAPRAYFMAYLRDEPSFHYDERLLLVDFANGESDPADGPDVARALTVVDVDQVCLPVEASERISLVRAQGYEAIAGSPTDSCFRR